MIRFEKSTHYVCGSCGAILEAPMICRGEIPEELYCPRCGQDALEEAELTECPICGKLHPDTEEICTECRLKYSGYADEFLSRISREKLMFVTEKAGGNMRIAEFMDDILREKMEGIADVY